MSVADAFDRMNPPAQEAAMNNASWRTWREHFETQALRPLPAPPDGPETLSPVQTAALTKVLARFQLGEIGEGRVAMEIDRAPWAVIDDDYRLALKRFVREEGRHARILKGLVLGLGGRLITHHWTDAGFTRLRRALDTRHKLLVLLAAEIVGMTFYRRELPRSARAASIAREK